MRTCLAIILLFATQCLFAQPDLKRNMLYGQLAGNGLFLSLNYERQLQSEPGLGIHAGLGFWDELPTIPLGVKYILTLGNEKQFIEFGAGVTFAPRSAWEHHNDVRETYAAGFIPSVGYRHHTKYGLAWSLNYSPVFTSERNILLAVGFSLGWRW